MKATSGYLHIIKPHWYWFEQSSALLQGPSKTYINKKVRCGQESSGKNWEKKETHCPERKLFRLKTKKSGHAGHWHGLKRLPWPKQSTSPHTSPPCINLSIVLQSMNNAMKCTGFKLEICTTIYWQKILVKSHQVYESGSRPLWIENCRATKYEANSRISSIL